jgi:hypothetical protein
MNVAYIEQYQNSAQKRPNRFRLTKPKMTKKRQEICRFHSSTGANTRDNRHEEIDLTASIEPSLRDRIQEKG